MKSSESCRVQGRHEAITICRAKLTIDDVEYFDSSFRLYDVDTRGDKRANTFSPKSKRKHGRQSEKTSRKSTSLQRGSRCQRESYKDIVAWAMSVREYGDPCDEEYSTSSTTHQVSWEDENSDTYSALQMPQFDYGNDDLVAAASSDWDLTDPDSRTSPQIYTPTTDTKDMFEPSGITRISLRIQESSYNENLTDVFGQLSLRLNSSDPVFDDGDNRSTVSDLSDMSEIDSMALEGMSFTQDTDYMEGW